MTRIEKIAAAKQHVADRIADIIEKNFDAAGPALETSGVFTTLLEAYRACEIAHAHVDGNKKPDMAAMTG